MKTESCPQLSAENVLGTHSYWPSALSKRSSDEITSIAVLQIFKNTMWGQKVLIKLPVGRRMWFSPVIGPSKHISVEVT